MKYKIESWKIIDLITLYKEDKLNLSPPYQRNFIWSKDDQDELIDSIMAKQFPLPTFFILKYPGQTNNFEMVDGQQRTRTILAHHKKRYSSGVIEELIEDEKILFEEFELSITLITELKKN